ncbi:MAG: hypothetical protein AB7T63_06070 [Planctomycetota bacterium]
MSAPMRSLGVPVHGRWVLDHAAIVEDLVRRGLVPENGRERAIAALEARFGHPVLTLTPDGRAEAGSSRIAARGRWSRVGDRVELCCGGPTAHFSVAAGELAARGGPVAIVYRRI